MIPRGTASDRHGDSGQTAIDFLFGMVIFVGAFFFILQFMSTSIIPFTLSPEDATVVSHKVSDSIVKDDRYLNTGERGVVNVSEENMENLESSIDNGQFGVPDAYRLNVTVEDQNGGFTRSAGTHFGADVGDVASTRRMAYSDEDDTYVTIKVRVW